MSKIPTLLEGLGPKRLAAVRQKARKLKTTPDAYFKKLIDDDLELDRLVATHSLRELSAPIRKAFRDTSEEDIGRLVDAVREKHRGQLSRTLR